MNTQFLIITGDKRAGKTTYIKNLIRLLKKNNRDFFGFYSENVIFENKLIGYDLVDAKTKISIPFLREADNQSHIDIGRFSINKEAIYIGNENIRKGISFNSGVAIFDEIGRLELMNEGWFEALNLLIKANTVEKVLITIRKEFLENIIRHFCIKNFKVIDVQETICSDKVLEEFLNF
jgi:nucleoside-triphosphatase THEP1